MTCIEQQADSVLDFCAEVDTTCSCGLVRVQPYPVVPLTLLHVPQVMHFGQ